MDPEVYKHKVRFLLDNPYPDYLELTFTDCVDDTGVLSREDEVDLVPGGSERQVTEENKGEYVDALLRSRMATAIADHVQSFKKGLNAIVPSELLSRMATFVTPKELSGMIAGLQVRFFAALTIGPWLAYPGSADAKKDMMRMMGMVIGRRRRRMMMMMRRMMMKKIRKRMMMTLQQ